MKFVKCLFFMFGLMLLGASFRMETGGDAVFGGFICYGFFAISLLIAWGEVKRVLFELRG